MNRFTHCLTLILVVLSILWLPLNPIFGQIYFNLQQIEVQPENPDDQTAVSIYLAGWRSDNCSFIGFSQLGLQGNDIYINLDWENVTEVPPFPFCPPVEIFWDTTIVVGTLNPGAYSINMGGTNYIITNGVMNPTSFVVGGLDCTEPDGSILVTTTADNGPGSLRQAITCANNDVGPNTILFNLSGNSPAVIRVGETTGQALPALTDPATIIDGTSHPAFGNQGDFSPKVILDGRFTPWSSPINAIWIRGNSCEIYGLEIINFPDDAIDITTANEVIIGGVNKGNVIYDNGYVQDFFPAAPGTGPWEGCGIVLRGNSNNCKILGNYIGTNYNQTTNLGNEFCGIIISDNGDNNQIGGVVAGEGNIIANNPTGIRINSNSFSCSIRQNSIYCNDTTAINLVGNANLAVPSPVINSAFVGVITGQAAANQIIEVFISDEESCESAPCQGKIYLGTAFVVNGSWTLNAPFANNVTLDGGELVTATATTFSNNTSSFANCFTVSGTSACTESNGDIIVFNANDEGPGSLREAINCANNTAGANVIKFNIPGNGPHTINVGSANGNELPFLSDFGTTIDGTTQPGYGQNGNYQPQIILDGSNNTWTIPINAIWIRADFCKVFGLQIVGFPDDAIDIYASQFVTIGGANKGNVIYGNGIAQDEFPGVPNSGPWEGCGIVLRQGSSNCDIIGNVIGTDYSKNLVAPNEYCGIIIRNGGDNNVVGGTGPNEGNIIANQPTGIRINPNSFGCTILQNSFYCNDTSAITLLSNANNALAAPVINAVEQNSISGLANLNDVAVDVYINENDNCTIAPCQGTTYLGTAIPSNGSWTLTAPFTNNINLLPNMTVTAMSIDGGGNSSNFAACALLFVCEVSASVAEQNDVTCGQNNGSVTFAAVGGTPPYDFNIGDGETDNPNFSNLVSGTYTLTVTDDLGCSDTEVINIQDSPLPTLTLVELIDETCEESNGSITVLASGGTPPFTYRSSPAIAGGPNFMDLAGGTYSISVEDVNGCLDSEIYVVDAISSPDILITNVSGETCDEANGTLTITATNGTPPFAYSLDGVSNDNPTFVGLTGGTYTAVVSDVNGCSDSEVVTITNTSLPTLNFTNIVGATCDEANGSFTVSPSEGEAPYTYLLGQNATSNPDFSGLNSGIYAITLQDANGCLAIEEVNISNTPSPLIAVTNVASASCGLANGIVEVIAAEGTPPYQFDIGNGLVNSSSFLDLAAGIYNVSVSDGTGCIASLTAIVGDIPAPNVLVETSTNPTCGNANGSILFSASGGTPPYNYSLGNIPVADANFSNLIAGDYTVTITDNAGCTATENIILTDPGQPEVMVDILVNETCDEANGSISFVASGGEGPYQFDIGNGFGSVVSFSELRAGDYAITVMDNNACTNAVVGTILNIGMPTTAAFTYQINEGTVDFMNLSSNADTYAWSFDDGNSSSLETPVNLYAENGDYNVCLTTTNTCGEDTYCELLSIVLPLSNVFISGNVATEDEINIAGVSVSCTDKDDVETLSDGEFIFTDLANGGTYTIEPHKDINYLNGVNVFDLYLIQQHILLENELATPYEIIAADVNDDGTINVLDMFYVQQLILLEMDEFPEVESWRFIPKSHLFETKWEPLLTDYPEAMTYTGLMSDVVLQDFIGVKMGDVSQSANPLFGPQLSEDLYPNFIVEDRSATEGEIITVDFKVANFEELAAFQFDLGFDDHQLEIVEVIPNQFPNFTENNFTRSSNHLRQAWYDMQQLSTGISIPEKEILFSVQFLVKNDFDQLSEQIWLDENSALSAIAFKTDGMAYGMDLIFTEQTVAVKNSFLDFSVKVIPNPFNEVANIQFDLPAAQKVNLSIYDVAGKLLEQQTRDFQSGQQSFSIQAKDLGATGIYFYKIEINDQITNGRMILQ